MKFSAIAFYLAAILAFSKAELAAPTSDLGDAEEQDQFSTDLDGADNARYLEGMEEMAQFATDHDMADADLESEDEASRDLFFATPGLWVSYNGWGGKGKGGYGGKGWGKGGGKKGGYYRGKGGWGGKGGYGGKGYGGIGYGGLGYGGLGYGGLGYGGIGGYYGGAGYYEGGRYYPRKWRPEDACDKMTKGAWCRWRGGNGARPKNSSTCNQHYSFSANCFCKAGWVKKNGKCRRKK